MNNIIDENEQTEEDALHELDKNEIAHYDRIEDMDEDDIKRHRKRYYKKPIPAEDSPECGA